MTPDPIVKKTTNLKKLAAEVLSLKNMAVIANTISEKMAAAIIVKVLISSSLAFATHKSRKRLKIPQKNEVIVIEMRNRSANLWL